MPGSPVRPVWTTPADLRAQTLKLWERGRLLAVLAEQMHPALGQPGGHDARVGDAQPASSAPAAGAVRQLAEGTCLRPPSGPSQPASTGVVQPMDEALDDSAGTLHKPVFPLRLSLKTPDSRALGERFEAARGWSAALLAGAASPGYRVVLREVRHRVIGANRVPAEVWLDTLDDALALIAKRAEAERFRQLFALTRDRQPALCGWLARRPLRALELAERWACLLDIVGWMQAHPRPGCYLRQVDLAGVDTKLIEQHQSVLAELLDLALPPASIDDTQRGQAGFARRYGFRDKPERVRLRVLDPARGLIATCRDHDYMLSADDFARLVPNVGRVFITENEINFLAFPPQPDSLVILGAGYGFSALAGAAWLSAREIHYWGDIDTHGFAILDQLRAILPQVHSLLMDCDTLLAHRAQWGREPQPVRHDLPRLTPGEAAVYDDLRHDGFAKSLRLEQERVGFGHLQAALAALNAGRSNAHGLRPPPEDVTNL